MHEDKNRKVIAELLQNAQKTLDSYTWRLVSIAESRLFECFGHQLEFTRVKKSINTAVYNIDGTEYYLIYKDRTNYFKAIKNSSFYFYESEIEVTSMETLGFALCDIESGRACCSSGT